METEAVCSIEREGNLRKNKSLTVGCRFLQMKQVPANLCSLRLQKIGGKDEESRNSL